MATTNCYYNVSRIPNAGVPDDAVFTGATPLASGNSSTFKLKGGKYGIDFVASTITSIDLKKLGQDASTWNKVITTVTANGYVTADLPPGDYRIELS